MGQLPLTLGELGLAGVKSCPQAGEPLLPRRDVPRDGAHAGQLTLEPADLIALLSDLSARGGQLLTRGGTDPPAERDAQEERNPRDGEQGEPGHGAAVPSGSRAPERAGLRHLRLRLKEPTLLSVIYTFAIVHHITVCPAGGDPIVTLICCSK